MAVSSHIVGAPKARQVASYLYRGTVKLTQEQHVALEIMAGRIPVAGALTALEGGEEPEYDKAREKLEALHTAFVAATDWDRAKLTAAMSRLDPYEDMDRHAELAQTLHLSLAAVGMKEHLAALDAYLDAVEEAHDRAVREEEAWQHLSGVMQEMRADFPVRLHASPEMRGLLRAGTEPLDQETVCRLLASKRTDGSPIPGKHYAASRSSDTRGPTAFYGLALTPGKSISAAWAVADPAEREAIRQAHEQAVETAMGRVADKLGWVRTGRGGEGPKERGEIAWVSFDGNHVTSRAGDPNLHTHVAIPNVVRSLESNRVGSFDLGPVLGAQLRDVRRLYHRDLAERLQELGFDATHGRDYVEIRGVPEQILQAFSRRTGQAREAAERILTDKDVLFDNLTPEQQSRLMTEMAAQTRRGPAYDEMPTHDDWERRAMEAVGTKEWERMAAERGWVWQRQISPRRKEGWLGERIPANPMGSYYHRGGQDEIEWERER